MTEHTPYDVIIVLGAAQRDDGRPGPAMERRVKYGVDRLQKGLAPWLLLSGGATTSNTAECVTMAAMAADLGVDATQILQENQSTRTLENAAYCARVLRQRQMLRCLLVTDRFHMPRAIMTFRAFGVEVEPAPVIAPWSFYTVASYLRERVARHVYPKRIKAYLEQFPESDHDHK